MIRLDHFSHGYTKERGHRLIAGSTVLDRDTMGWLERLSDLSGHLPVNIKAEPYFSGWIAPNGQYVFSYTVPTEAERSGTVHTHSVLLPMGVCPFNLVVEWKMLHGWEVEAFKKPLLLPDSAFQACANRGVRDRAEEYAEELQVLLLKPPVLWESMSHNRNTQLCHTAWHLKPGLAFCTFALGPRKGPSGIFDLLCWPIEARAAFLNYKQRRVTPIR